MSDVKKPRDLWTDEEFIAAFGEKAKRQARPYGLGALQRPGWTGKIRTYLIWCRRCCVTPSRGFTVAHLAGYAGRLECASCRARFDHLLPARRLEGAFNDPISSPRMLLFLLIVAMLIVLGASQS